MHSDWSISCDTQYLIGRSMFDNNKRSNDLCSFVAVRTPIPTVSNRSVAARPETSSVTRIKRALTTTSAGGGTRIGGTTFWGVDMGQFCH